MEAVPATFARRAIAFALDWVLAVITLVACASLASGETLWWLAFLFGFFIFVTLPALLLVAIPIVAAVITWVGRGRTPGKALVGIAVRDAEGGGSVPLSRLYGREAYRGLMFLLLVVPSLLDHLSALRDPLVRTKHDRKARTVVVRTSLR